MKLYKRDLLSLIFLISGWVIFTQELPPINSYLPEEYGAENQNWSISQSKENYIYVANNKGLLEFNGASWQLYPTPNETLMRCVKVMDNKIFTGFYMDFGFWKKNNKGILKYTSIVENKNIKLLEDEHFWNILELDGWLLFQSLQRIYLYNLNSKEIKIINTETSITKMMILEDTVYFQQSQKGLYKIDDGQIVLVTDSQILKNTTIINIFKKDKDLLLLTSDKGLLFFNNNTLQKWNVKGNNTLINQAIYSGIQLKNKDFVFGTVSNGLVYLNKDGSIKYQITQKNGLTNNTVLSLFEDKENTIWLGLDSGINAINTQSPFIVYTDNSGELGTIYTSILYKGYLYLGTNQGLFYKKYKTNSTFQLIENTEEQVWCLKEIDGVLFCGHNTGTFIVNTDTVKKISDVQGTWDIKKIDDNTLIQGNYNGLNIIKKTNDTWQFENKIEGFNNSSRYLEMIDSNTIFVNHEYKGVFKLTVDKSYQKVLSVEKEKSINKGIHSSIIKYKDKILYANKTGVYSYNLSENKFKKDSLLNKLYSSENFSSGKLMHTKQTNKLWAFSKYNISYAIPGKFNSKPTMQSTTISENLRKGATGFENIICLEDQKYLIGISNGYIILNENKKNILKDFNVSITSIVSKGLQTDERNINLSSSEEFKALENNIQINYSTPIFNKFSEVNYQYTLTNDPEKWSDWSTKSNVLFENLSSGNYSFKVRSKIGDVKSQNIATYNFSIQKPWYLSGLMLFLYLLSFILLYLFLLKIYTNYYKKRREQVLRKKQQEFELKALEAEKEVIKVRNTQLLTDIESKNRELASSTMNIIKKNEFLNNIKTELKNGDQNNVKSVIRIIDKNLNNTDDWNLFKEAFNNADKDFIKKVKTLHPELTPNDLRLCAYLRLNLSSKEIAPLLNISPRSVEVKRYRLRKKINLERDINLTNYILEI